MILAQTSSGSIILALVGVVAALVMVALVVIGGQFISLYIQAQLSNAPVGLLEIFGMRLRKVDARQVIYAHIRACNAGLDIPIRAIETHYLAGGDIGRVISAMIAAKGADIELPWSVATSMDLAGRDVPQAVPKGARPEAGNRSQTR